MTHDPMTPQPEMTPQQMMQQQHQQNMQMQQMQMQQMQQQHTPRKINNRTKGSAAILAFLLGGLGVHKFYLGQAGQGILYLLFCWTLIPAFVAFLEMFVYLSHSEADFDRKYNYS